jgi:tetratricopeptide (TPR) repeat protein
MRRGSTTLCLAFVIGWAGAAWGLSPETLFQDGTQAYRAGDFERAARMFHASAQKEPASGTLQNLGNAQWQRGDVGGAILAWEQALWLDPFNAAARGDLRFARKTAQVDTPELAWYEVVSTWLPAGWWAWITGAGLWLAVGMLMLPGILRQRKAGWHQTVAALGLMVFLLSLPAQLGVRTRSRLGFVTGPETGLRLTPTAEAQLITRLPAGKPLRAIRRRGTYVLVRTSPDGQRGWLAREEFGLVCAPDGP